METTKNYNPINTASIVKIHSSSKLYETGKRFYSTTDNEAITDPNVTTAAYRILSYLLSNNESFSPNQKVIARKLSMSKNTVRVGIENLKETGYLEITQTGHNQYHYNISAISFQGSKTDPTNIKVRGQKLTHKKQAKNQGSIIEGSIIEGSIIEGSIFHPSKTGLLNNDNLNNENSNNDNLNSDNFNSNSTVILDKKSSAEASIFYSENFATQNVPQPDNVIFGKKAESEIKMYELPYDPTANLKIENEINKLNESDTDMKIKLNDNEYFETNDMFVEPTANLKIECEIKKLDSDIVSTAINDSAQENIKLDGDTDSVHSAQTIDVITPNIEKTEQQKLNDNLYDKAFNLFGDVFAEPKIDNLDAMIDDEFGEDARKKLISNSDIVDDTDWKPVGKIDTAKLKANAEKHMNTGFKNITSFDPTFDI